MHATATFELHNATDALLFADDVGGAPTGRRSFDARLATHGRRDLVAMPNAAARGEVPR